MGKQIAFAVRCGLVLVLAVLVQGCQMLTHSPATTTMNLSRADFRNIPGWNEDNHVEAFAVFMKSCVAIMQLSDTEAVGKNDFLAPAIVWKNVCRKGWQVNAADEVSARQFFENEFIPLHIGSSHNDHAFLTGYYEPLLSGSRVPQPPYVYPVYVMPPLGTSYTRQQIDSGFIRDQVGVIAFVDDPVQLFFMHVQGSGAIELRDGQVINVGYAGSNGQTYASIGKYLVQNGLISKQGVSMQVIRQWLYDHPDRMWQTLWQNPSYIFFQEINGGPYGSQQVELTPGRSLAVDKNYIPLGMPVFVDTVLPGTGGYPFLISRSLMIAQDTGSAIKGPQRGDIFFGAGYGAEQMAGRMQSGGEFTALVPRALARVGNAGLIGAMGDVFTGSDAGTVGGAAPAHDNSSVEGWLNRHNSSDNTQGNNTLEGWFEHKKEEGQSGSQDGDTLEQWFGRSKSGSSDTQSPADDQSSDSLGSWWQRVTGGNSSNSSSSSQPQNSQQEQGDTLEDFWKRH